MSHEYWTKTATAIAAATASAFASAVEQRNRPQQHRRHHSHDTVPAGLTVELDAERAEWEALKVEDGMRSAAMDQLMDMAGMQSVKQRFINICQRVVVDRLRQFDHDGQSQCYNVRLEGNPGEHARWLKWSVTLGSSSCVMLIS